MHKPDLNITSPKATGVHKLPPGGNSQFEVDLYFWFHLHASSTLKHLNI